MQRSLRQVRAEQKGLGSSGRTERTRQFKETVNDPPASFQHKPAPAGNIIVSSSRYILFIIRALQANKL